MKSRHKARELALQILYQMEMQQGSPKEVMSLFWKVGEPVLGEVHDFATALVEGVYRNQKEIDQLLESYSAHWRLDRMAVVDRNILRLSGYELLYSSDIPTSVVLNEGIEIAKKFGTGDSGSFINGILDRLAKEVRKEA